MKALTSRRKTVPRASTEWPPTHFHRLALGFVPRTSQSIFAITEEQAAAAAQLAAAHHGQLDGPSGSGKTHIVVGMAKALAKLGRRVLILSPRKPLAMWLRQSLRPHGIDVQTIDGCARAALGARYAEPPVRRGFHDPEFFAAAADALPGERYDLVVGEEWQTTTAGERHFVRGVAGSRQLLEVLDSSRDIRESGDVPDATEEVPDLRLSLTRSMRSPGRVELLDRLYVHEGLDPLPTSKGQEAVTVTSVATPDGVLSAVQKALAALARRGVAPSEIGVISALGRAQSTTTAALCAPAAQPRAFQLTEAASMTGTACDSFAYWLGLERRAIVVVEAPANIARRRTRLHIAISRACEAVHLVMARADIEADTVLRAWMRTCEQLV